MTTVHSLTALIICRKMFSTKGSSFMRSCYILSLLTLSYLVGEMGHFMLGATSRDMAREIGKKL